MKHQSYRLGLCAIALGTGFLPFAAHGGDHDLWFSFGPVFRGGMDVKFSGSSYVQTLGLHSANGPLTPSAGVGPQNGYYDRTYDNGGYVKKAPSTGNPNAIDPNTTWNWGFTDPAQYNAAAQTLTFQKQGSPGYTTLANGAVGGRDEMLGTGLQLLVGMPVKQSGKLSLDLVFGFQGVWGAEAHLNASTYSEDVRQITVADTYDVSGIPSASFPAGGYQGTYDGPFGPQLPPYPIIPNLPASRASATSAALSTAQNHIAFDMDQSLYEFSLGPQIGFAASSRLKLHVTPTISLNIVDVDLQRSETFAYVGTVQRWSDHVGTTEAYMGLGITGGANLDLGKGWFTGVFGGYEWVMENVNLAVGPSRVSVNASGWTAGLQFGKQF